MVMSEHRTYSVDTPDDLDFVKNCMENDTTDEQVSPILKIRIDSRRFYFYNKSHIFLLDRVLSELPSGSPVSLR